jgi:L-threonylcarbamoyladenylate synthase
MYSRVCAQCATKGDMALKRKITRLAKASPEAIAAAARCLRAGGLVAMPTETVYGLAAGAAAGGAGAAG